MGVKLGVSSAQRAETPTQMEKPGFGQTTGDPESGRIVFCASTQKGAARETNGDRVLARERILSCGETEGYAQGVLALVCDGVGTDKGAAEAAQIAAEVFRTYRESAFSDLAVRRAALEANEEILAGSRARAGCGQMCTTATGICIQNRSALLFHVGDSKAYRFTDDRLVLLTEDHTPAWKLYRSGLIPNVRDAPASCRRTVTRYLGGRASLCIPDCRYDRIPDAGCLYLLCSDGVWGSVGEAALCGVLQEERTLSEKCRAIMELALQNGSTDDRSLVLLSCPPVRSLAPHLNLPSGTTGE